MEEKDLEKLVKIYEPTEKDGVAFNLSTGRNLKLVAVLYDGRPFFLEKDYVTEIQYMNKKQIEEISCGYCKACENEDGRVHSCLRYR